MRKKLFLLTIAWRYMSRRRAATIITVAAIAVSLLFLSVVSAINFSLKKNAAERSVRYPLVIGPAESSGIQIVMNSIFHIDKPSGLIPFAVFEKVLKDHRTLNAYPLAIADSVEGTPIIGTNEEYIQSFHVQPVEGVVDLSHTEDAVLGSEAAIRTGFHIGDKFKGSHGMEGDEDAHEHAEVTYVVRAILAPVGGPEDGGIYISYKTVWAIHKDGDHDEHEEHGPEKHKHDHLEITEGKLTSVLVKTRNPAFSGQIEREYSDNSVQAVDSGRVVRKMASYLNKAEILIELFNTVSLIVVTMMIFVTIIMSLNERRHELALMRSLGIGRIKISLIIMIEALILTLAGAFAGVIISHITLWFFNPYIHNLLGISINPFMITGMEQNGILITLIAGQLLAWASMLWVYRMNLVEEIAN